MKRPHISRKNISAVEWAERYYPIKKNGEWKPIKLTPVQKSLLDIAHNGITQQMVLMFGTQLGKTTTAFIDHQYIQDKHPRNSMIGCATQDHYKRLRSLFIDNYAELDFPYSEFFDDDNVPPNDYLANMYRHGNGNGGSIGWPDVRYKNSVAYAAWSGSDTGFKIVPVNFLLLDEIDSMLVGPSASDPIQEALGRTTSFGSDFLIWLLGIPNPLSMKNSFSRINEQFKRGSREYRHLPHKDHLLFIEYPRNINRANVCLYCHLCDELISPEERMSMLWDDNGIWIAENENSQRIRSFQLSQFYSVDTDIETIFTNFDPDLDKRNFYSSVLAEVHDNPDWVRPEKDFVDSLIGTYQNKQHDITTVGIDVQKNRFEFQVLGWHGINADVITHQKIDRTC